MLKYVKYTTCQPEDGSSGGFVWCGLVQVASGLGYIIEQQQLEALLRLW